MSLSKNHPLSTTSLTAPSKFRAESSGKEPEQVSGRGSRNECRPRRGDFWCFSLAATGESILAKVADPLFELCEDYPLKALERVMEPWIELFDDGLSSIRLILAEGLWLYRTYIWSTPKCIKWFVDIASLKICDHPLTRGLREIVQDGGNLWLPLLSLTLCGSTGGSSLVLAKVGISSNAMCAVFGGGMVMSAITYFQQIKGPPMVRTVFRRALAIQVLSGMVYFGIAAGGLEQVAQICGFSDQFAAVAANFSDPMFFAICCKNMITYPLMTTNILFVCRERRALPGVLVAVSNGLVAAGCTTLFPGGLFLDVGALSCLIMYTRLLNCFDWRRLRRLRNIERAENAVSVTILSWVPQLLIVMSKAIGWPEGGLDALLPIFLADATATWAVVKVTTKDRVALNGAANWFSE